MPKKSKKRQKAFSLLEGDVLEKLRSLPDDHFDLVVTSPPYNIGKNYERSSKLDLDSYLKWLDTAVELLAKKNKAHWQYLLASGKLR